MNSSLNHIYRVVWNASLGLWQVASEVARNGGKTQSEQRKTRRLKVSAAAVAGAFAGLASLAIPSVAFAQLPTGGQVVGGQASIVQNGNALNINQGTDRAAIDWKSFNVGQGNTVNFNQPSASSIALNRVLGSDVSVIQGAINANGQVFLVNQNGILFTPTAQVNVGGIVASTQSISTADFMAGKYTFSGNSTGTVENQGNITTSNGGTVALIAAKIINTGTITAPQGTVGLAAGNTVTLDLGGPVKIQVTQGALNSAIEQGGGIVADGGQIYLTAKAAGNLAASVINHTGVSRARTLAANERGEISLMADLINQGGTLSVEGTSVNSQGGSVNIQAALLIDSGTTSADGVAAGGTITHHAVEIVQSKSARLSAKGTGASSTGGSINLRAGQGEQGQVLASGEMNASGTATGGQVDITANSVALNGVVVDTSGGQQAGKQRIGGGWQGREEDIPNARTTTVVNSTLNNQGANGTVVVWSDEQTTFSSTLKAQGSAVEISGKENLAINTDRIQAQSLLLDPKNIEIKNVSAASGINVTTVTNPNAAAGDAFATQVLGLANGNFVVTASNTDVGGVVDVGRVYLYSSTGSLISMLSGSQMNDKIGSHASGTNGLLTAIGTNNVGIGSSQWNGSRGAFTWMNGTTGALTDGSIGGIISSSNSLIGSSANDRIAFTNAGTAIQVLTGNGNLIIRSENWNGNGVTDAGWGALTWMDGNTGKLADGSNGGAVSSTNSLVGSRTGDRVGFGVQLLSNGNYVSRAELWDAVDGTQDVGAVTYTVDNGTKGMVGTISASNSLVGTLANDSVGSQGINPLGATGNFVIISSVWNGTRGAATFVNGSQGLVGNVSSSNSLVGAAAGDRVGFQVNFTILSNNNYLVTTKEWNGGRGAITWGSATTGVSGVISESNSLVGANSQDRVGGLGITTLSNGNAVVGTSDFDNGATANVGAVTWINGANGKLADGSSGGVISSLNSLVGASSGDFIGTYTDPVFNSRTSSIRALTNGNYVVQSPNARMGSATNAGAVTFGNGETGSVGIVGASNSLVGTNTNDYVGLSLAELSNGNYVIGSSNWNGNRGAATLFNGVTGFIAGTSSKAGTISSSNSLVGSTVGDKVGDVVQVLQGNGNYVLVTREWSSPTTSKVGAVTWGDGALGSSGVVSADNSVVGNATDDFMAATITSLVNGNYAVRSADWNGGRGSVTFVNGTNGFVANTGMKGATVSAVNSLVGKESNDRIGNVVLSLTSGNFITRSSSWNGNRGAVTFVNGSNGQLVDGNFAGEVSVSNSLVGSVSGDQVGGAGIRLNNGNLVIPSLNWGSEGVSNQGKGAVTWMSGIDGSLVTGQKAGEVSALNSVVGSTKGDRVGLPTANADTSNYLIRAVNFIHDGKASAGAVLFVNGATGQLSDGTKAGTITSANAILGNRVNTTNQGLGSAFQALANGSYVIRDAGDATGGSFYVLGPSSSTGAAGGTSGAGDDVANATFASNPSANNTITPEALKALLDKGTAVTLQANNDITLTDALTVNNANGAGGALTLEAGRNININNVLTTDDANFTAIAGSTNALAAHRDAGDPTITIGTNGRINAGTGTISLVTVGSNGKFVNNAGATPFTAAKTLIYLPTFNTLGNTVATLGGLTASKRYNTTFNATTSAPTSTTAKLDNLTGVNLLYAVAPTLNVAPATGQTSIYGDTVALSSTANLSGFVDGDTSSTAGISGTAVFAVAGQAPTNGLRNAGKHDVAYQSGLASDLGYTFADATAQVDELTITPKALNITTNEFVSSATANAVIATTDGLVAGQTVSALNLDGKNLSVAFGQNTLASNYNTTVVVPGASGADLAVNRDLSLTSGLNLTLRSDKNILVNKVIDATTGTGSKVSLEFGQGAVAAGNTAEYVMNLVDTTFNGKINLLKGQNFATKQGSDGELLNYTVITELGEQGSTTGTDLQGMNGNVAGRYVLGAYIDATVTNTWNVNNQGVAQGFAPLVLVAGSGRNVTVTPFSGTFDGLGHAVSNLTINRSVVTTGFGLFGSSTGFIRHLGLSGGSVTGGNLTGALVGTQTGGSISHVYSTVNVNGTSSNLGGLIGRLQNASVRHARSSGTVSSSGNSSVGGLIGAVSGASTVTHIHATGNVQASNGSLVGGLVGFVSGSSTLTDVSATGQVTGFNSTGGLIGSLDDSTLSRAFASGAVNGPTVGTNNTNSYGGLLGDASNSTISDVFATGAVNAGALREVGGLIGGLNGGSLTNGYATGALTGMTNVGGLIGFTGNNATLSNSFWNTQTTGRDNAVGTGELSATSAGNAGKTTAQLQNAFTFIDAGWNFDTVWGKSTLGANNGYMQLRNSSNDNFDDYVKVADSSKVYGAANSTITGAALSGVGIANVSASLGSAVGELSDAGEYLYSTENVLNVTNKVAGRTTFVDRSGKLTITPKALTVALQAAIGNPLTKVYDGNETIALGSGNFALSGFVGQQGVGATLGGVTSGTFNSKNVLQATTVSADIAKATLSGTAEGFKSSNYSLPTGPVTAAGTITAKGIAVTGLAAQNKTYDGNRNAVVTGTAVVDTSGVIQGDTVNVTGTVTGGLFADKDAGNDKAVSVSGLSLSGTDAGNYAIVPANLKANIAQKALTITGTTVANKDYDGNTNATVTVGTITGVVEGETLGSTTATGQFAGKDVVRNAQGAATAQNVTVAYTLANGENPAHKASNYTLASETKTATINPKALTITGSKAANKTYDGNTAATVTAGTLSGLVGGETLGATTATGQFADKNAGTGKNVTVAYTLVDGVGSITAGAPTFDSSGNVIPTAPMTVPGAKASNYSLAGETLKADIAQKQVSITEFAASNKTYDGNTTATISNAGKLNGVLEGDAAKVALTNTGATFDTKDAGTAKTVTLNGKALTGDEAKNYVLASDAVTAKADIAQKQLTVTGFTAENKTYDGNTTATISNAGTLNGVVQGDAGKVALNNTGATFDTKDAGTAKTVTLNGKTLTGDEAKNYVLATTPVTAQANIAQKQLTIAEFAASNKVYDGNTTATISNAGKLIGVVEGDTGKVALGNTGATFDTKNAGTGKTVTLNGANITGTESANYTLAPTAVTAKADIAKKEITLAGFDAANKVYDGNTTAQIVSSGSLTGVVEKDAVTVSNSGATFDTKNAGTGKTVTLNGVALSGSDAENYSIANTATDTADIAQKQLTVTGFAADNKTYDGNNTATISNAGTLNGVVQGDAGKVALNNTGATFDTKDAGTAKTVTLNGKTLSGDEAKNYVLATTPVTAQANIDKRALSIAGSVVANKTYDGNTTATVTAGTLSGLVQGETLGATTATGQFADKNAGTGKNVTVAYTLANGEQGQASNYSLAGETLKADIAQKQVNITEFAAANKVYDGNTTATISNAGKLNGVLEGDAAKVALTNTGATFDTKSAGTGKTVTLNGKALTGDEAKNYVLASETVTAKANITKKAITLAGFDAANKVYDGNTTAQVVNSGSLTGVVQNDTVMVSYSGATFDTNNAGTGKTVTLNGVELSGTDAGNYSIASTATDTANITQKQLTIAEFAAANKVYDGNTTATIANAGKLVGVVEGDTGKVALGNTGATFDTKNAGTGKTVTLNGANITGAESANYTLAPTAVTAKADIAKKEITLAGFDAANKVYDGNTVATITNAGSLTGVVTNDTVMVSNSGATFDTKNAGTGKTVTLNGVALSGGDAGNYSIANTATDTADITQKAITLTGFDAANKVYDGNTVAQIVSSGSLTGVVTNDTVMVSNSGATFDTKNAGTAKTVTLNGVQLSGTDATNYSIANTATDTASITQKAITLTGFDAANKVYDGNTTAQILNGGSLAGVVEKDTVMVSNSGATFDNRNAGTAKTVTLNGVVLSGTDAGNYSIANTATDTADITKRGGVVLTALNKEKQLGEADPALTFEVTGLVQGDSLTGSLSRVAGETPGFYAINRGTVDNPNYEISQFNPGQLQINQSLPQETIATVNTLSSPDLRPSLGERPPLDQGGAPQSQAQDTPFLVTPAQVNTGGPAQVVVIEGGINLNFAGTSASGAGNNSGNNSGNTSEQQ